MLLPQLSFVSQEVASLIKIDFISTLPQEIALKILCYLDCNSLCNAAQVSRKWKTLADDDQVGITCVSNTSIVNAQIVVGTSLDAHEASKRYD